MAAARARFATSSPRSAIADVRDALPIVQAPTLVAAAGRMTRCTACRWAASSPSHPRRTLRRAARLEHAAVGRRRAAARRDRGVPHGRAAGSRRRSRPRDDPLHRHRRLDGDGSELGDSAWSRLVEQHHAAVRRELDRYAGEEIDTAGDGFFAVFDGPARAIRCALGIQHAALDAGSSDPGRRAHGRGGAASRRQASRHRRERRGASVRPRRRAARRSSPRRCATSSPGPASSSRIVASTSSRGSASRAASISLAPGSSQQLVRSDAADRRVDELDRMERRQRRGRRGAAPRRPARGSRGCALA